MKNKKIVQYSMNGDFIAIHNSIKLACDSVGLLSHSGIVGCCKLKPGSNSTKGYQWRYYNDAYSENIGSAIRMGAAYKERYGHGTEGADCINNKKIETCIKKYGKPHHMQDYSVKKNYKDTCIKSYGTDNPAKNIAIQQKISHTERARKTNLYISELPKNFKFVSVCEGDIFILYDSNCNHEFNINRQLLTVRRRNAHTVCTICNAPDDNTVSEIETYLGNAVESMGIVVKRNVRDLTNTRKEIDIFLPEYNIGIEVNGAKFHSEEYGKFANYHLDKSILFKEAGVRLYHFFDDEIENKIGIIKSMIANSINMNKKIYARKCSISAISNKDAIDFANANHMQGGVNGDFSYGLYNNNELLSIMTFCKPRKYLGGINENGHFEMLRFCTQIGISVVGGASKLLSHFIKTEAPNKIISYANRRWSNGDLYNKIGFTFVGIVKPGFYYFYKNKRVNRISMRRSELIKLGCSPEYKTSDMIISMGAYKIWDCGNYKYSMDL